MMLSLSLERRESLHISIMLFLLLMLDIKVTWICLSSSQSYHCNCNYYNTTQKTSQISLNFLSRNFKSFCTNLLYICEATNQQNLFKNEMEFKVRKESQTLMEKTFNTYERRGCVRTYQLGSMLKAMRPDLSIEQAELDSAISRFDTSGEGKFDLDTFNKIAVHFLVKAARRDSDSFIHKHHVYLSDFPDN